MKGTKGTGFEEGKAEKVLGKASDVPGSWSCRLVVLVGMICWWRQAGKRVQGKLFPLSLLLDRWLQNPCNAAWWFFFFNYGDKWLLWLDLGWRPEL